MLHRQQLYTFYKTFPHFYYSRNIGGEQASEVLNGKLPTLFLMNDKNYLLEFYHC